MQNIMIEPLTRRSFTEFGDVVEVHDEADIHIINDGTTTRFHDLATIVALGEDAQAIISIFRGEPFSLPLTLNMVERHPLGSQSFMPLKPARFLVIAAPDEDGKPGTPRAFFAQPGQGINFFANTWHGPLTALDEQTDFLVVDRDGDGDNLEIYDFPEPYLVNHA